MYTLSKLLPPEEKFGLASQMRRAAVSIPSNIAEGKERRGNNEFRHFLSIARGSASELETQLMLCEKIYGVDIREIEEIIREVQAMMMSIIKKL